MPEDYGVVAMGMLVVSLIQTFLDFGPVTALLRKDAVTTDEIDSAWTLRMMQGFAAAGLISLAPPLAIPYFQDPRLTHILWTLAACVLLASFTSLGPVLAQKEFNFALNFKIETTSKLASVATTLIFGFLLEDYRALVYGISAGYLTPLLLSYALHPCRHTWNTRKIKEIWHITKWLLLANMGGFILRKGDEFAAARIGSTNEYGTYNVGADLGALPVAEVGPAILRALLPVLSSIQADVKRTNEAIIKTVAALSSIVWPIGLGVFATAHQATEILLGSKWASAASFVGLFAIITVIQTLASPLRTLLTLRGHTRIQSRLIWIEFGAFVIFAITLVPSYALLGLAGARLTATMISLHITLMAAQKHCDLPYLATTRQIIRPMLGAILMAALIHHTISWTDNAYTQLACGVLVGGVTFILWSFTTWHIIGRPEGLESTVMDKIGSRQ